VGFLAFNVRHLTSFMWTKQIRNFDYVITNILDTRKPTILSLFTRYIGIY